MGKYRVVTIAVTGKFNLDTNAKLMSLVSSAAIEYGSNLFLVDETATDLQLTTLEIFEMPERNRALGALHTTKIAFVITPSDEMIKAFSFYEHCACAEGFNHRFFVETEQAINWLTTGANAASGAHRFLNRNKPVEE